MKNLYDKVSDQHAVSITKAYSTSFSIAVRLLDPSIRQAIYNIYGFVRLADEIVDSFDNYPQKELFDKFEEEYNYARKTGISSNPIINAFLNTVREYRIDQELVEAFLNSMRLDLTKKIYTNEAEMNNYIYGSADVVGLMCLRVFVKGDDKKYNELKEPAMKLGSAFQKVNFLRDLKMDLECLERSYFPEVDLNKFSDMDKDKIVKDIRSDFDEALKGIKALPKEARFGVYLAYKYYLHLLKKIDGTKAETIKNNRVRISNYLKSFILFKSYIRYKFKLVQ